MDKRHQRKPKKKITQKAKKKLNPVKRFQEYRPLKHLRKSLDKGDVLSRL